ncbi:MAG: hypothetical protein K9J77_11585 [Rhodoferax sp.]|nr:hypothetical protein [Rhodoferax sp.]
MPRIERLHQKREKNLREGLQIQAQIAEIKAAQRERDRIRNRIEDSRRKEVMGAVFLKIWQKDKCAVLDLRRVLSENVRSDSDRELFGIPPLNSPFSFEPYGLEDAEGRSWIDVGIEAAMLYLNSAKYAHPLEKVKRADFPSEEGNSRPKKLDTL